MKKRTKLTVQAAGLADAAHRREVAQLNEQNRLLREQVREAEALLIELKMDPVSTPVSSDVATSPAPGSAEFEARENARQLGKLEGRADAFSEVISDLLRGIFGGEQWPNNSKTNTDTLG